MQEVPVSPLIQNLQDAGCDEKLIENFMKLRADGTATAQLKLLAQQRCALLACLHENQKRLDCLDYLIYQLKNNKI